MTPQPRYGRGLFGAGVLLGLMAEQVVMFAVPLLLFQDTKQVSTLGYAFALEWLPGLIAYPFAGLIADRDGGARLFSVVTGSRAVVLAVVVAVLLTRPGWTTPALMTSGAVLSILVAPTRMSVEKMVPQLAAGEAMARTQALVQNMELLAMALGPALATLAAALIGKVWLLAVAASVFALAAACWLPLPRGERPTEPVTARATLRELGLGWKLMAGNRPVLLLGILNFGINLVVASVLSANAALVTGVFAAPDWSFALLNTCVGVVGLVNLLVIPLVLKRFEVPLLGVLGFAVLCAALLLIGIAGSFPVYAVLFIAVLTGTAYYNVFNRTSRVKVIPREHLGKVMGPFYLLNLLSYPIAGLLVGSVGATYGPQRLVGVLAVVLSVFGAVLLPLTMRSFRRTLTDRERLPVGVQS
ncbi:MFS transporter [Streptomyces incarnatus]|uniref:MFS transporter n=1 Tax=Streptomyces sp. HF10 TaxID=2692233 RepID=UPI0011A2BF4E|nr:MULTISPECIES: MFS transporter [Streptomyces]QHC32147.1 MFS transporter [Streptomyces sp. HF10]